jgi:hypothetical protein
MPVLSHERCVDPDVDLRSSGLHPIWMPPAKNIQFGSVNTAGVEPKAASNMIVPVTTNTVARDRIIHRLRRLSLGRSFGLSASR